MADNAKKAAVLNIVRQTLISWVKDIKSVEDVLPKCYEDLQDGVFLYTILSRVAPQSFPDSGEIDAQNVESRQNCVVRKGNIMALVRRMNDHVHKHFGAPDTLDLNFLIDAAEVAASNAQGDELTSGDMEKKSIEQFMELIDFFLVIIVFSGDPVVLQALKSLPYADKLLLSNAAKVCITKHALRPRKRDETTPLKDARLRLFSAVDDEALQFQLLQLRRELEDANSKIVELDSKLQFALGEKQEWESKYKKIIGEMEQKRSALAMEQHLRQLLEKKELAIKSLTATAEEHAKRITAFKEATAAQETALSVMKRKLMQMQGELLKQNVERREALDKLTLAEEKLTIQVNARNELERELEDLRTELAIIRAQPNSTCENDTFLNHSFGSVNSVDRVVQLENELDELRSQKETAERLLSVFQRQLLSMPSEELKSFAATDALKTQLRQAEKEKEELRKQLAATIGRLEEVQCRCRERSCAPSIIDGESESFIAGQKSNGTQMDTDALPQNSSADMNRCKSFLRGKRDEYYMREQTALVSNMLILGYRNLMLQQRASLAGNRSNITDNSGGNCCASGSSFFTKASEGGSNRQKECTGSFLTQHRYEVEKGLFNSVFGCNI